MNLHRFRSLFDLLASTWRDMHRTARPARDGRHYKGSRPQGAMGRRTHDRLAAARKRERQGRRYARYCRCGQKHRFYGRP